MPRELGIDLLCLSKVAVEDATRPLRALAHLLGRLAHLLDVLRRQSQLNHLKYRIYCLQYIRVPNT